MKTLLMLALAVSAGAADLGSRVREVLDASPAVRSAFWGIQIVEAGSRQPVYELNAGRYFVPASNTKLFTTALGLSRLGPQYRYVTTVVTGAAPDSSGRVPWLRLVGGGDPNLSARAIPYRTGPITGNPLAAIDELAAKVAEAGVKRVEGDVIGDDTAYEWEPFPDGWAVDDPVWEYGAPVSALTLNDNAFTLTIRPGSRAGELARLELSPAIEFYYIDNRVRTVASGERQVRMDREPGSRQLRLWGTIPLSDAGQQVMLGISDPALYAAMALREALEAHGVAVQGRPVARHAWPNQEAAPAEAGFELARHESAPLVEDLRITDKVSQNLHAELTLRAVGKARRGNGSRQAGLEEMQAFLDEAGVERGSYNLNDGSGLSRLNLVAPAAVVRLLTFMRAGPLAETWVSLLPVGGVDGTLEHRMKGTPAEGRIHAKTGSLSHASALSGYADRPGGRLIFSILVNNYNNGSSEVRAAIDKICTAMLE